MRGWRDCCVIAYCFPQRVLLYIAYSVHKILGNQFFVFVYLYDSKPHGESGLVTAVRIASCIRYCVFSFYMEGKLHFLMSMRLRSRFLF